jgi:hypothetical protein
MVGLSRNAVPMRGSSGPLEIAPREARMTPTRINLLRQFVWATRALSGRLRSPA